MSDLVSSRSLETPAHRSARWPKVVGVVVLVLGGLASLVYHELRTSAIQSWLLSRYAARLSYEVKPGPSASIAFPRGGPFDTQRGYPRLDDFRRRLESAGYTVAEQARQSAGMVRFVRWGVTPPYREPAVAGLVIRDYTGVPLYDARPRDALFASFDDVPALIVSTLLFLENRELTNPTDPGSNPAIDWGRLGKASGLYVARGVGLPVRSEGGSTLAVQIEKYRHSQSGRTASPLDKLRQLAAASLRAYRDGPDSTASRREIVLDYLNTMPLAAAPGYGEVHGLGNGLRAWFDLDLDVVEDALNAPGAGPSKAAAYKHVLALLYAVRAPTRYLVEEPATLEKKITAYGDLLLKAGVIDRELYRELRETSLRFGGRVDQPPIDFSERRAPNAIREDVRRILGVRSPYEMDRLHLEIDSTIDGELQDSATRLFRRLGDKAFVDARGLRAEHLLLTGDPSRVVYSLLLFERTPAGNLLRVQADNLDRPFDINSGMKMELGSTAKLRTLAHYLEVMESLHAELAPLDTEALDRRAAETRDRDPLTRWAAETLRKTPGLGLEAFLAQALDRTYPAHPWEAFFTGGGVHSFENFEPEDNRRIPPVHEALAHSTNLVFIRLMRDLVRYQEARLPYDAQAVLADPDHPERRRMLEEMADKESRQYLARAYAKYQGLESSLVLKRLLGERVHSPRHVAIVFFAWNPGGDGEALQRWSDAQGYPVPAEDVAKLVRAYGNPKLTLLDYGYLVGRHPLDLWVAGELSRTPALGWDDLMAKSGGPRELASNWLLQARQKHPQDLRVRIQMEQDAFARMTPSWRRLGFPFEQLVPSYATAIGSSADRPAALAELMGIIANDGVRRPTTSIQSLRFAADTPYHTVFAPKSGDGERVMSVAVARALRKALAEVVEAGTARRVAGAFQGPGGKPIVVGGKTGSGDNRFDTFAGRGRLISSRPVSRTAAFVFYIGDRYFGIATASITGKAAGQYQFTSALPVTVLRFLAPEINARVSRGVVARTPTPALTAQAQERISR
jgi:membrane peptidoglycan carboxypeptidase